MLILHTEHNPISVFAGKAGLKMKNQGMKKKWRKLLQACLHTITRIYLVFRDGRAYDAGAVRKEPLRTGETVFTKGQIYWEVTPAAYASAEEVMERFGGVLLPAGQAESNQDGK